MGGITLTGVLVNVGVANLHEVALLCDLGPSTFLLIQGRPDPAVRRE